MQAGEVRVLRDGRQQIAHMPCTALQRFTLQLIHKGCDLIQRQAAIFNLAGEIKAQLEDRIKDRRFRRLKVEGL